MNLGINKIAFNGLNSKKRINYNKKFIHNKYMILRKKYNFIKKTPEKAESLNSMYITKLYIKQPSDTGYVQK